jgi:hypothetical protein
VTAAAGERPDASGAPGRADGTDRTGEAGRRLVDEALRLVEAFREADGARQADGHTGPECRVCPVCRVFAAVRTLRPEAVEHLAVAAAELASAWREVVAGSAPPPAPSTPPRREPSVERIDVTD